MGPRVRVRAGCAVGPWNPGRSRAEYTLPTSLDGRSPALTLFLLAAGILVITATMGVH